MKEDIRKGYEELKAAVSKLVSLNKDPIDIVRVVVDELLENYEPGIVYTALQASSDVVIKKMINFYLHSTVAGLIDEIAKSYHKRLTGLIEKLIEELEKKRDKK